MLRDQRGEDERHADRERAERLLTAAEPDDDGTDPASWPAWALRSANNLAAVLLDLGEYEQGRDLSRDTLTRRRRVLGPDHPDTRRSAWNLAGVLRESGGHEQAGEIEAEYGLSSDQ